jgi:hypothetical protein
MPEKAVKTKAQAPARERKALDVWIGKRTRLSPE